MAEASKQQSKRSEPGATSEQSKSTSAARLLARITTPQWLVVLLLASAVVHAVAFTCYCALKSNKTARIPGPELCLGVFRFDAEQSEGARIAAAEFSLCISLLEGKGALTGGDDVGQRARRRLQAHRYRVQQDIEELLRQAHSGDFEDPTLAELKRQLQEQINETLGFRAIADVIITDLKLEHVAKDPDSMTTASDAGPWREKPSG